MMRDAFRVEIECSLVRLVKDLQDGIVLLIFQCHPKHIVRVSAAHSQEAVVDQMGHSCM